MNPFTAVANLIRREPVIITTAVGIGVATAATLGFHLTPHEVQEAYGGAAALAGIVGRGHVTPTGSVTNTSALEGRIAALEAAVAAAVPSTKVAAVVEQESAATAVAAQRAAVSPPVVPNDDALVALATQAFTDALAQIHRKG